MKLLFTIYMFVISGTLLLYLLKLGKQYYERILLVYLLLVVTGSLLALYSYELFGRKNNLFLFHFYTPLELMVLGRLYYVYFENKLIRHSISITVPLFVLLSVLLTLLVQGLEENNSFSMTIEALIITCWSLLFLRETLALQRVERLQAFPMFWISIGFLFYFIGHLFSEGLMNYLMKRSMELALKVYLFSFVFKFILFILLIMGAYCERMFRPRPSDDLLRK